MHDWVGNPKGNNLLEHDKFDITPARLTGTQQSIEGALSTLTRLDHENTAVYPNDYSDFAFSHVFPLSMVGPLDYVNKALSRRNPNRPKTDFVVSALELREFPRMIKHVGDALTSGLSIPSVVSFGGSAPISWTFGWEPLINDLKQLFNIAKAVEEKAKMLKKLKSRVVTERFQLDDREATDLGSWREAGGNFYRLKKVTKLKAWCQKKHTITPNPLDRFISSGDSQVFANNLEGTDEAIITVWNALPWSWLLDYFVGISDFLEATGNRIPGYQVTELCIMRSLETQYSFDIGDQHPDWNAATLEPLKGKRITKSRFPLLDPNPQAPTLNLISAGQLQNLGNLLLARLTR
jgi:hypothetical protein